MGCNQETFPFFGASKSPRVVSNTVALMSRHTDTSSQNSADKLNHQHPQGLHPSLDQGPAVFAKQLNGGTIASVQLADESGVSLPVQTRELE